MRLIEAQIFGTCSNVLRTLRINPASLGDRNVGTDGTFSGERRDRRNVFLNERTDGTGCSLHLVGFRFRIILHLRKKMRCGESKKRSIFPGFLPTGPLGSVFPTQCWSQEADRSCGMLLKPDGARFSGAAKASPYRLRQRFGGAQGTALGTTGWGFSHGVLPSARLGLQALRYAVGKIERTGGAFSKRENGWNRTFSD